MKRLTALALSVILLTGMIGLAQAEETVTYTWWIARGEDTTFYDNYAQNPVVQYFLQNSFAGKKIDLQFWQGISGAEKDNFNNMLSTDSLADVVDLTYSDYTPATLLEDGYILDLTPYVEQYMPNYSRLLAEDEELQAFAYSHVNGEKKILFLTNFQTPESFAGYCYRRDWVAKYGVNPQTGAAFTYGYNENGEWSDDVVFPNGTDTPLYISDWEWMFEIFTRALQEQGITDGYCTSLYYTGAMGSGDLYSSFGGGCPWWYQDKEGNAAYGGVSDNMRVYLQAMNTWWNNGWIDKAFAQRSGDMYFSINSTAVHAGKVGLWMGRQSEVGNEMESDSLPYTQGIMVYGAPQPINDVYGTDANKNIIPDCFYQQPSLAIGVAVTTKAKNKDLAPLFTFLDSLYDPYNANLCQNGFSAQMIAAMAEDSPARQMYLKFGLDQGCWIESDEEGVDGYFVPHLDVLLSNAMKGNRLVKYIGYPAIRWTAESRLPVLQAAIDLWDQYEASAYIRGNVDGLISPKNTTKKSKIDNNQRTYQSQSLPKFIMGDKGFDISNDADWANYCKVISKYGVDKVTEMYQEALDILRQ